MKSKWLTISLGLLLSQSVIAQQTPQTCPSIAALQAASFQHIDLGPRTGTWVVWTNGSFSTPQDWSFLMTVFGQDQQSAFKKAYESLKLLYMVEGPVPYGHKWYCVYNWDGKNEVGVTVTPAIENNNVESMLHAIGK